jgi:hypothetical protein
MHLRAPGTCPNTLRIGELCNADYASVNGDSEKINVSKIDIVLILRTYLFFVLELWTFKTSVDIGTMAARVLTICKLNLITNR